MSYIAGAQGVSFPARGCPPTAPLFLVWEHAHSVESYLSLYAKTLPLWGERLALDAGFSPPAYAEEGVIS